MKEKQRRRIKSKNNVFVRNEIGKLEFGYVLGEDKAEQEYLTRIADDLLKSRKRCL